MLITESLRRALRQFSREPLYAFASAGTLALAVAAAVASFAVVKPALVDPLPYRDGHTLVTLLTEIEGNHSAVPAHLLRDLASVRSPLTEFASIRPAGVTFIGETATESLTGNVTTASYFQTLGVQPAMGRPFGDGERDAVVVSWAFWQRAFAGDAGIVGRRVMLDGTGRTVIGVMPQGFVAPYWPRTDVWLPLDMAPLLADPARGRRTLTVIARRTASQSEVDAFLAMFSGQMRDQHPAVHGRHSWVAEPLRDELVGVARPALMGTGVAALLLLLIVCANIAGLSAARAVGLRQQFAVRAALGATRGRLFVERLADSLVVAGIDPRPESGSRTARCR